MEKEKTHEKIEPTVPREVSTPQNVYNYEFLVSLLKKINFTINATLIYLY